MTNSKKSVFSILTEGLGIYIINLRQFLTYMAFPVFGQILGIIITLWLVFTYSANLPIIIAKYPVMDNFTTISLSIILLTLPGLFVVTKAVWDYLIAYCALNSMAQAAVETGKVYDFKAHENVAYKRIGTFVVLWFIFGIYSIVAAIPIFFLLWILLVYFAMIFQVFTFESKLGPSEIFAKSFRLSKGHFLGNFIMMAILGGLTFLIIPKGVDVIFDFTGLSKLLGGMFASWCGNLPLEQVNQYTQHFGLTVTAISLAKSLSSQVASFIGIGFTLPLRSICFTLRYADLNDGFEDRKQKTVKKKRKTATKTVQKSTSSSGNKTPSFKIESRKIDPEIIRRARLEDDEY
jgi:hypothetical protein